MNMRYRYAESLKSSASDEWINTYLIRPLAGLLVWPLYYTSATPNQLTVASTLAGIAAAWLYFEGTPNSIAMAGVCITLKDILDSADGQLARAKRMYSRAGRFLDSLSDVIVNGLVFGAIGWMLFLQRGLLYAFPLAFLSFLCTTLRVSYHVYYHTAFLHLHQKYDVNRLTEDIREEDMSAGRTTLMLQRMFQVIYGWQDRLMARLDHWCSGGAFEGSAAAAWYEDRVALRLSGLIGMGTELAVLTVFSLVNQLEAYLVVNVLVGNALWLSAVLYRRYVLRGRIRKRFLSSP